MFKMILFDVDGVLLSEERYFDASALTVWEMLFSPKYLGLPGDQFESAPSEEAIRRIRREVFVNDKILDFMKSRGINANWDMVYLSFCHQLLCLLEQVIPEHKEEVESILGAQISRESIALLAKLLAGQPNKVNYDSFEADFASSTAEKQALLLYLNDLANQKLGIETTIFSRTSELWELCQETFQEWYLGDQLVEQSIERPAYQTGKKGFLSDEIPIVDPKEMAAQLSALKQKGLVLGIGTGRPSIETIIPLKEMGLIDFFDSNRVVTASHVLDAENEHPERAPLAKPQPFCYIKGWLGLNVSSQECFDFALPMKNGNELLIVGDSVADYMAAKSMGCKFAATLTGLTGQEARGKFEELGADYILNDMREILEFVIEK